MGAIVKFGCRRRSKKNGEEWGKIVCLWKRLSDGILTLCTGWLVEGYVTLSTTVVFPITKDKAGEQ
jgi:hypothetical protein